MTSPDYNMNLELSNFMLGISGTLLTGSIIVIWFVVKSFTSSVKDLKKLTYDMNTLIMLLQEKISVMRSDIDKTDTSLDHKIKELTEEINRVDCELSDLKREVDIIKALNKEYKHGH